MHKRAIWETWEKRASLYLMYKVRVDEYWPDWMTITQYKKEPVCRGMVARALASTTASLSGENGRGFCTIRVLCPNASAKGTVGRYAIRCVLVKFI
ncbi:hypothetical protein M9H77_08626 [Catharanthus roseus]|uniref:Uncharacterized protein n=1 Tax=Catharanthus roseus TaxID=4058 RepID=A0ACC0BYH4_CATRO|nr:hypothetical protein M9H77_08626 [Catharanthus roseus]